MTAPREDSEGAKSCMLNAIKDAKLTIDQIGHINCHATSTPLGDQCELNSIKDLFTSKCDNLFLTSTKGSVGHLLGAAGATEAIFSLLACYHGIIPPTLNLDNPIDRKIKFVANQSQQWEQIKRIALSNSFGFGGTNASLIFSNFVE